MLTKMGIKITAWIFQMIWLRKGNVNRETESLLIAAQINTIKTNNLKATVNHHHDVVPLARISQTLLRHFSQSFIASGMSSGLHPVSSHSCCMFEMVVLLLPDHMQGFIGGVTYELVLASPAVSCMSGSSSLDSFRDGRQVAVQMAPCGVLRPGLVQYCSQHSCVIAV